MREPHILVRVPSIASCPPQQTPDTQIPDAEDEELHLGRFATSSEIKTLRTPTFEPLFRCNRPHTAAPPIPITLLHPEFNLFLEECDWRQPSKEDNAFALELAREMSGFFDGDIDRRASFLRVCENHGLSFAASKIKGTEYRTDGDMRYNELIYCLAEQTLEMGSESAEPVFKAGIYYMYNIRGNPEFLKVYSPFPCLGVYLIGATLGFFGLVFTDNTHIQVLGPALRLDYHHTDVKLRRMTSRYLGAFRRSTERLRKYYETEYPKLKSLDHPSRPDPRFPCYNRYTPLVDSAAEECEITYTKHPRPDNLVFFGKVKDVAVCIKFTTSYSKEAHLHCASLGLAPKLLGFEELPNGWCMVVMDRIDDEYIGLDDTWSNSIPLHIGLRDSITNALASLHQAGYVHGDFRAANVMVRRDGREGLMLIDFDWAGRDGEVCYPMNVNSGRDLWRPEGSVDEAPILGGHDVEMVQHVLDAYVIPYFKDR
ncbi:hypothetical protein BD410DRAFT_788650 [Rickenella mellea]|uniref:Uncharacterized protein n=1 Tax=Rickenella mellea TaxID=50990 RepID=A0A4Y7Q5E0_9AGAM|nr:hypothetical protein BD410DRAFT_788650 [Rickenella mellea]